MILEPDRESELMNDEIFGPILPIMSYQDISEAINFINSKSKPLTVYYFGLAHSDNAVRVANETSSGHFLTNEAGGGSVWLKVYRIWRSGCQRIWETWRLYRFLEFLESQRHAYQETSTNVYGGSNGATFQIRRKRTVKRFYQWRFKHKSGRTS